MPIGFIYFYLLHFWRLSQDPPLVFCDPSWGLGPWKPLLYSTVWLKSYLPREPGRPLSERLVGSVECVWGCLYPTCHETFPPGSRGHPGPPKPFCKAGTFLRTWHKKPNCEKIIAIISFFIKSFKWHQSSKYKKINCDTNVCSVLDLRSSVLACKPPPPSPTGRWTTIVINIFLKLPGFLSSKFEQQI